MVVASTWGPITLPILFLTTIHHLGAGSSRFVPNSTTAAYLFEIIVYPIYHVVLKVGPETVLATLSKRFGAMQALRPLLDEASELFHVAFYV